MVGKKGTKRILIIGGGASGVLTAYHLLRTAHGDVAVTIIEQSTELGFGLAYSTRDPRHLLNVRSANMSALPDDPSHFCRWLSRDTEVPQDAIDPNGFATRRSYGRYIASLIADIRARHTDDGGFDLRRGTCTTLSSVPEGVCAGLADGRSLIADIAIIATGHERNRTLGGDDPWDSAISDDLQADAAVLILGSGLTMVDYVCSLLSRGHRGTIHVLSRRGLLPQVHKPVTAKPYSLSDLPHQLPLSAFLHWLRLEVRQATASGQNWRSVLDGLRPHTQTLWQRLPGERRRRFLRHLRPWWDVHRHRMAPEIAQLLNNALEHGRVKVNAGKIVEIDRKTLGIDVTFRPRGSTEIAALTVARVVDCTGLPTDSSRSSNLLTLNLLRSGLARNDTISLGLDVTADCALIDANGSVSDRIFAVGPATRSQFWEIVAIPDIRNQCADLAERLTGALQSYSARSAA